MGGMRRALVRWAWFGVGWGLAWVVLGCLAGGCGGSNKHPSVDGAADGFAIEHTPGSTLAMEIDRVAITGNRQVQVDFRLLGPDDGFLDRRGFTINWTLAVLTPDPVTGEVAYTSLITRPATGTLGATNQPAAETSGPYEDLPGESRYTFGVPLPDSVAGNASLRVAAWAQQVVDGGTGQVANASKDFVPDGSAPQDLDAVSTPACNQCHDPMSAHGGARREVPLCVTCHTPQLFDPDTQDPALPGQMNPLDFPVLIHRLHEGVDLPTLVAARQARIVGAKYDVVGFRNADIVFAQTVASASPDPNALPDIQGIGFPRDIRDCVVCHQQAPQATTWQTVLSRSICGSCHDATWFAASPPPALLHAHPGGPMADDRTCGTCHPQTGSEFDLSVVGAHTVPSQSKQLRGLVMSIVSAAVSASGNPTVVFSVTNGDGSPVQPLNTMDVLAATVSGPTTSYIQQNIIRQDMRAAALPNPDGTWTYTFASRPPTDPWLPAGPVIPMGSTGTFAVGLEGRRAVTLAQGVSFEEGGNNPVGYFSVDGSKLVTYTNLVDLPLCDRCHGELRAHGNLRRNPEYCVLCHAADATDWAMRPKGPDGNTNLAATIDKVEERSIRFPSLIHRIHTGDELVLTKPFVVYGFGGSPNRFDDVRFPGDRRHCTTCHLPDRFTIESIPATALPTRANETGTILHMGTPVHPANEPATPVIQSACLGCHDDAATKAHATLETTASGQEACLVCHGENRQESVRTVHLAD